MPLFAIVFSSILAVFGKTGKELEDGANQYAIYFAILGAGAFFVNLIQIGSFAVSGERLTRRIRLWCFESLMKQEIGFFDDEKNSPVYWLPDWLMKQARSRVKSIAYGALEENPSDELIQSVAKMANIHDFIMSLPEGYNTMVGEKGGQLSGGEFAIDSRTKATHCNCQSLGP